MSGNSEDNTLWTQSMFESLFSALRSGGDDAKVKEVLQSLSDKGYSTGLLVDKVRKTEGPRAAARVQSLCGGDAGAASASHRHRYKVSRVARLKNELRHWWGDQEDQLGELWYRIQAMFGRG